MPNLIACGLSLSLIALLAGCGGSSDAGASASTSTTGAASGTVTRGSTTTTTTASGTTSSATTTTSTSTAVAQPAIASFSPTSGPTGTVLTVSGSGLTGISTAYIGGATAAAVTVISDTQAKVTVPSNSSSGVVKVLKADYTAVSAAKFTVTSAAASTTTASTTSLKVSISGDHFVDATGKTLQLRGANVSGLEFVAVQGWDPSSPWGGQAGPTTPNFTAMKSWDINVVRLPLNEASWLGYTCVDATGASRDPDPGHNYQSTVIQAVADATAAGLYVIIDLHWTAPKNFCPLAQNPMADADNSLNFWKSVATQFKGSSNVLFELFNEPYVYWLATPNTEWQTEMQGGSITQYVTGASSPYQVAYTWKVASMQDMLNTVRATGATNPVLIAGVNWAGDLSEWLANKPTDSLNQIAAVWHAYPAYGTTFGTSAYALPGGGAASYANAQSIISAGIPVVITESGDQDSAGTVGAPFESKLLPWADKAGASYLGWAWDVWQNSSDVLIKDASGTPTDGYGTYFKQHLNCVAAGTANCQ